MADPDPPPLVLLHAFPLDARMWDGVRERLAERTRLITPDLCGLGDSSPPDSDPVPSLDDAARDVVTMLDRLGIQRAVLGGCSMGGYVTMALLRAVPQRLAGLVLIDTKAEADDEQARRNRDAVAERAERAGSVGWLAESMLPNLLGADTRSTRPDVVENTRELIDSQSPSGVAWAQRAMARRPDSRAVLRRAEVPALVLVGEQDSLTGPEQAGAMAAELGDSQLVRLAQAGHLSPLEVPGRVADAVGEWLDRQG